MLKKGKQDIKRRLLLRLNQVRFNFMFRRKRRFFEIVINERYENVVKSVKYVLTIISLISAFLAFKSAFTAFVFGLIIFLVLFIIEKTIFSYCSMYVHPLPNFEIETQKWTGCGFGYATSPNMRGQIPVVSWIFSDAEYAKKIHSLLLEWSYGELKDDGNNICASIILDDEDKYIFFCYPSFARETASDFFNQVEREQCESDKTRVHHKMHMVLMLGKEFVITPKSYLPTFCKRYRERTPYIFRLILSDKEGKTINIEDLPDFVLFDLKIKKRQELDRKDIEYDFIRFRR